MGRLVASINVTLDGYCNHNYVIADEDLHKYASSLIDSSRTVLFGRGTYQIFESYWPHVAGNPDSVKDHVQFAMRIDSVAKIVFSKSIKTVKWKNVTILDGDLKSEILELKSKHGHDLLTFGSPSLIMSLSDLRLVDEYHFVVQPMMVGEGRLLSQGMKSKFDLRLTDILRFSSGVVVQKYEAA